MPPLLGTVGLAELLRQRKRAGEVVARAAVAAIGLASMAVLVILPFWIWHATEYVTQVPIDHQSRHNLLQDLVAQDLFFWAEHGVLVATSSSSHCHCSSSEFARYCPGMPWRYSFSLSASAAPPRCRESCFGEQWAWLTYDRFSIWADVPLIVLLGAFVARQLDDSKRRTTISRVAWLVTLGLLGGYSLFGAVMPALVQTEPRQSIRDRSSPTYNKTVTRAGGT